MVADLESQGHHWDKSKLRSSLLKWTGNPERVVDACENAAEREIVIPHATRASARMKPWRTAVTVWMYVGIAGMVAWLFWETKGDSSHMAEPASPSRTNLMMNAHEYTNRYAEKLRLLYPELKIAVDSDLQLSIGGPGDYQAKHWLDNSYAEYRSSPENFDEIVVRYGKAVPQQQTKSIDKSRIIPVVKDEGWIAETNAAMKSSAGAEMNDYLKESLADGLLILYAEDRGETIAYLHADDLKSIDLGLEALHSLALENLKRLLPAIQSHNHGGVYYYTAGGTYESCLILFSWMWTKENCDIEGDVVFTIPTRDVLMATGSKNAGGIERMKEAVAKIYADKPNYRLTGELFTIHDGKISRYLPEPTKPLETTDPAVVPASQGKP